MKKRVWFAAVAVMVDIVCAQKLPPVTPVQRERLEKQIVVTLTARPMKARRLLVFWRCEGYAHKESIAVGNEAFRIAAEKTKAFAVDFTNEYDALRGENLEKYDALVLNNSTGLKTKENPFVAPSLISFVASGKGLTVIHAGADSFYNAHEVAEMIGGLFWGHPWGGGGVWAFHVDEPSHPLNAAFAGKDFKQGEEVYMQCPPYYSRAKSRVLLSLDLSDPVTGNVKGRNRPDNDYAVSWIKPYGKGRVFYTSFGHDARAWMHPAILLHMLDGLQYTLGDLKVDDTPAGLSSSDVKRIGAAEEQTVVYSELVDLFAHTYSPAVDAANREKIAKLLSAAETTTAARKGILRAFQAAGAPKDLSGVAAALAVPETREPALTLLAQTRTKEAAAVLSAAWEKSDSAARCGILHAFLIRGESESVARGLKDGDASVVSAALLSLGQIGDKMALEILSQSRESPRQETVRYIALAACLERFIGRGEAGKVRETAKTLFAKTDLPAPLRAAAARALVRDDASFFAIAIKDVSPFVRRAVFRSAQDVPAKTLLDLLRKSNDPQEQVLLIGRLYENRVKESVPLLVEKLSAKEEEVVCAALHGLALFGGAAETGAILSARSRGGKIADAANETLCDLPGKETGIALFRAAEKDSTLLPILGERLETGLIGEWDPFLSSADAQVRKDAWKALAKNATEKTFPALGLRLMNIQENEALLAEGAVSAAGKQMASDARTEALVTWSGMTKTAAARKAWAGLAGTYPSDRLLPPLEKVVEDKDPSVREVAIDALGKWTDISPLRTLKKTYSTYTDKETRRAVIRSFMKLLMSFAGNKYVEEVHSLFLTVDEEGRLRISDFLFQSRSIEAFSILQEMFRDPVCGTSAKKCYVALYDKNLRNTSTTCMKDVSSKHWKADASHKKNHLSLAFDGKPKTRWDTGTPSVPGMWFTLDLGETLFVTRVEMNTEGSPSDTPNGCDVFASCNGKDWTGPVATADGNCKKTTVLFPSVSARFLKVVTKGARKGLYWSIHELRVSSGLEKKTVEAIAKTAEAAR